MKKLLLALPVIALLAAGCNTYQQTSISNQTQAVTKNTNPTITNKNESIFIVKSSSKTEPFPLYQINLETKQASLVNKNQSNNPDPWKQMNSFPGFPKDKNLGDATYIFSKDNTQVLFKIDTQDNFNYSPAEYICNLATQVCQSTTIYKDAYDAFVSNFGEPDNALPINWQSWDSTNRILYGSYENDYPQDGFPIILKYNIDQKILTSLQTPSIDTSCFAGGSGRQLCGNPFSPSFKYTVIANTKEINIYNSYDFSLYKSINLSSAGLADPEEFVWKNNSDELLLLTRSDQFYLLKINPFDLSLIYYAGLDSTLNSCPSISSYSPTFTPNDNIIFMTYVDPSNTKCPQSLYGYSLYFLKSKNSAEKIYQSQPLDGFSIYNHGDILYRGDLY